MSWPAAGRAAGELTVEAGDAAWLHAARAALGRGCRARLLVTHRRVRRRAPTGSSTIRPCWRSGVGAELGVPAGSAAGVGRRQPRRAGLPAPAIACVVSLDLKAAEPAVHALAAAWACRRGSCRRNALARGDGAAVDPLGGRVSRDRLLGRGRRCGAGGSGPAGPAAGAQAQGRARHLRRGARRPATSTRTPIGQPQGRLAVVGLGPGGPAWRTAEARAPAGRGRGTGRLRPLSRPDRPRRRRQAAPRVPARCRGRALPVRAEARRRGPGGRPGLLGRSRHLRAGDAGVRAAGAAPRTRPGRASASRSAPGVSALQAAAARAGAPLGHDFCAISLSDLLTPCRGDRAARARGGGRRLRHRLLQPGLGSAAAQLLAQARDILLEHRARRHAGGARPQSRPARRQTLRLIRLRRARAPTSATCSRWCWSAAARHAGVRRACTARTGSTPRAATSVAMTVHFIGAGPGRPRPDHRARPAADPALPGLPLCGLAGAAPRSWPRRRPGARVLDTASMHLDQILAEIEAAHTAAATTWRGSIPATRRSTARSPSRSAGSTRWASPGRSRPACRPLPPRPRRWAAS